jgi:hypothetical protein
MTATTTDLLTRHGELILALPDAMRDEPITPEMIDGDGTLTDEQKAEIYDMLFEYHGDEEH